MCFLMTRAEDFEDQFEGMTLEEYYQEAIENLRKSGFLPDTHYRILRKAQMPEMKPMSFSNPVDPSSIFFQGGSLHDICIVFFHREGRSKNDRTLYEKRK